MFGKILIANRGEIACRVMRTAHRMGIRCVAVYSDADARALHVESADEACRVGPPAARDSYLNAAAILDAARSTGAEAIHPGYGFLSENAGFADACAAAGVTFIGPPAAAIRAMGSKSAAKALMAAAGVPLVPGYHGDAQDDATLAAEAARLGYPLMIKATAGGGGKGMRRVAAAVDFAAALASCRREAKSAFGDDRVLIERCVDPARHIEIQVFADRHGGAVHLFERDCSVQRRHQKVLEEAPAPGMTPERRARMGAAAVAAARSVGYVGAGTVEFIVAADGAFYFMEMNTRLQVEHPVTEMITGEDLVEWQLRVAAGEPLPKIQSELAARGHAIEARIYAEDPARGFLPATGRILSLRTPPARDSLRLDTGVRSGDDISPWYDAMIGKLIAAGRDRAAALEELRRGLGEMVVAGLTTNIDFLGRLLDSDDFASARLDTGLIERNAASLLRPAEPAPRPALGIALFAELQHVQAEARARAAAGGDPHSPWNEPDGWRLNAAARISLQLQEGERRHSADLTPGDGRWDVALNGEHFTLTAQAAGDEVRVRLDGQSCTGTVLRVGRTLHVLTGGARYRFTELDAASADLEETAEGDITAPMPGKVIAVMAAAGTRVEKGAPLMVLEAMKMEHTITATGAGTIRAVQFAVGDQVTEGAKLVEFEAE